MADYFLEFEFCRHSALIDWSLASFDVIVGVDSFYPVLISSSAYRDSVEHVIYLFRQVECVQLKTVAFRIDFDSCYGIDSVGPVYPFSVYPIIENV